MVSFLNYLEYTGFGFLYINSIKGEDGKEKKREKKEKKGGKKERKGEGKKERDGKRR